ncbi:hypothetical protein PR048_001305 [Dryococelus australis]|uniref:Uncharacterized protein n=1 Tax=Dryococelus australis TaxID=614101 RepID=A0ABQ9IH47_9NEOP|nr:hypothetical protein PR048_001305 [Dryococelus australis]
MTAYDPINAAAVRWPAVLVEALGLSAVTGTSVKWTDDDGRLRGGGGRGFCGMDGRSNFPMAGEILPGYSRFPHHYLPSLQHRGSFHAISFKDDSRLRNQLKNRSSECYSLFLGNASPLRCRVGAVVSCLSGLCDSGIIRCLLTESWQSLDTNRHRSFLRHSGGQGRADVERSRGRVWAGGRFHPCSLFPFAPPTAHAPLSLPHRHNPMRGRRVGRRSRSGTVPHGQYEVDRTPNKGPLDEVREMTSVATKGRVAMETISQTTALKCMKGCHVQERCLSCVEIFGRLLRADEGEMSAGIQGRGKPKSPRENQPKSGIIRHDSLLRKIREWTNRGLNPDRLGHEVASELCVQDGRLPRPAGCVVARKFHSTSPGTTVAERLACAPPTKAIRVESPAGSLRMESCRTMPLVGGISRGSPVSPALSFRCCSVLISITLIGCQDLDVKSRPNLFTHSVRHQSVNIPL